jgi:hypothetical protein
MKVRKKGLSAEQGFRGRFGSGDLADVQYQLILLPASTATLAAMAFFSPHLHRVHVLTLDSQGKAPNPRKLRMI